MIVNLGRSVSAAKNVSWDPADVNKWANKTEKNFKGVSYFRCGLLSSKTGYDVQSTTERREHPAGVQGGQEEQNHPRYVILVLFCFSD